jgi:hypothetical protein
MNEVPLKRQIELDDQQIELIGTAALTAVLTLTIPIKGAVAAGAAITRQNTCGLIGVWAAFVDFRRPMERMEQKGERACYFVRF